MSIYYPIMNDPLEVEEGFLGFSGSYIDEIIIVDEGFTGEVTTQFGDELDLLEQFGYNVNRIRGFNDELEVEGNFVSSLNNPDIVTNPIPAIDAVPIAVGDNNKAQITFQLFTNPDDGSPFLTINAPEFSDKDGLEPIRINEYTRGGSLIQFHNDEWGNEKQLEYTFNYLSTAEKTSLINFIELNVGRTIKIKDHLGIYRIGIIINPEGQVSQPQRKGFSGSIVFVELME